MLVEMCSDITINPVRSIASDEMVVQAARVSLLGANDPEKATPGLINYLMSSRHGSPFEHNAFTFYAEAPIFVFREWHRHRISSINEKSARYATLLPKFYTPGPDRFLVNVGTSARPEMAPGTDAQRLLMAESDKYVAQVAWDNYAARIDAGISNELARTVLPVSVYSQMYWTVNARSLMNFLSLRVNSDESTVRSRPQWEIQMAADKMDAIFAQEMPITHQAFVNNGRVAP